MAHGGRISLYYDYADPDAHWLIPDNALVTGSDGTKYAVLRDGKTNGPFHLMPVASDDNGKTHYLVVENGYFYTYQPIHPSVTPEDVQGATHAVDDGTHWLFYHASEEQHHEMALHLEALTLAAFQPQIEQAVISRFGAIDTAGINTTTAKLTGLMEFRNDVFKIAKRKFYTEVQGHYHLNDHLGHFRSLISGAVQDAKNLWKGSPTKKLQLPAILSTLVSIEQDLENKPTIKTRAQKAAEEEAAKKKKAETTPAAETPAESTHNHDSGE